MVVALSGGGAGGGLVPVRTEVVRGRVHRLELVAGRVAGRRVHRRATAPQSVEPCHEARVVLEAEIEDGEVKAIQGLDHVV